MHVSSCDMHAIANARSTATPQTHLVWPDAVKGAAGGTSSARPKSSKPARNADLPAAASTPMADCTCACGVWDPSRCETVPP